MKSIRQKILETLQTNSATRDTTSMSAREIMDIIGGGSSTVASALTEMKKAGIVDAEKMDNGNGTNVNHYWLVESVEVEPEPVEALEVASNPAPSKVDQDALSMDGFTLFYDVYNHGLAAVVDRCFTLDDAIKAATDQQKLNPENHFAIFESYYREIGHIEVVQSFKYVEE